MLWLVFGTLCPCAATSQTWYSSGPHPLRTGSGGGSEQSQVSRNLAGASAAQAFVHYCYCCVRHLAVRVDPRVDEPLQYELGELVLQGCYCSVEGLGHLGHVGRHVGAEILKRRSTSLFNIGRATFLHCTGQRMFASSDLNEGSVPDLAVQGFDMWGQVHVQ